MVNSDHQTLQRLRSQAHIGGRRARYAEFLQEFDVDIQYIKGETNVVADAFSRRPDLFSLIVSADSLDAQVKQAMVENAKSDDFVQQDQRPGNLEPRLVHKDGLFYCRIAGTLYVPKHRDAAVPCLRKNLIRE